MAWNRDEAAAATAAARVELDALLGELSAADLAGVDRLRDWWRKWYNGASGQHPTGHKALARLLITNGS